MRHHELATLSPRLREAIQSSVSTDKLFAADGDAIQVGRTAGTTVCRKCERARSGLHPSTQPTPG